jgi:hypothetical protein
MSREGLGLLSLVGVISTGEKPQFSKHVTPKLVLGKHSPNGLVQNSVRSLFPHFDRGSNTTTARVTRKVVVLLL